MRLTEEEIKKVVRSTLFQYMGIWDGPDKLDSRTLTGIRAIERAVLEKVADVMRKDRSLSADGWRARIIRAAAQEEPEEAKKCPSCGCGVVCYCECDDETWHGVEESPDAT